MSILVDAGIFTLAVDKTFCNRQAEPPAPPLGGDPGFQPSYSIDPARDAIAGLDSRAFWTAGGNQVAWIERHVLAVKTYQLVWRVAHVVHEIPRAYLAVMLRDHFERSDIADLIGGHDHRAECEKRIDAFRARQIAGILGEHVQRG